MTCGELRDRFDAYVDGRLSDSEAAALEAHLQGCTACHDALTHLDGAIGAAGALPRSVTPPSDLWPGIERRLESRRPFRRRVAVPGWQLAAAAVLLVAVSSAGTALLLRQRPAEPAGEVVANVSALESQYSAASAELSQALEQARARLSPATVATIERSLRIIDAALAESREALARDPGNPALGRLVVAAWQQKVDLLRRATALGKAG
ncbi:MAG TPA: zf-HC2 domain-containing protein [Gemmatimonadales bacterium]|nr:zf-HC2 domain-containing protein [Gemmatimonadales bacterium]